MARSKGSYERLRRAELRPADSPEANRKSSGRGCQKPLLSLSVVFDVGLFCEKRLRELVDAVYRDYLDAFGTLAAFGQIARHDDAPESEPCGLADALFGAGRGAHFARQAYFAGAADPLGHGTVVVGCLLYTSDAADD